MYILTLENQAFDLSKMPDEIDDDFRFSILDNSNPNDPDFYFLPLVFLESFNTSAMVLNIGGNEVAMPIDWSIAVGCSDAGVEVEVLPLTSLNDRGFEAYLSNPISSFRHSFAPIEIVNVYNDVKWFFPKLKPNHLLAVPLNNDPKPLCAFFIKDVNRQSEIINYYKLP